MTWLKDCVSTGSKAENMGCLNLCGKTWKKKASCRELSCFEWFPPFLSDWVSECCWDVLLWAMGRLRESKTHGQGKCKQWCIIEQKAFSEQGYCSDHGVLARKAEKRLQACRISRTVSLIVCLGHRSISQFFFPGTCWAQTLLKLYASFCFGLPTVTVYSI